MQRTQTHLIVGSAILWLAMVGLACFGHWLAGLYTLLGLLLVYGVLGSVHKGRLDLRLVAFPSLVWLVLWSSAFWLGDHYAVLYEGREPGFTILGFHPSFAAIVFFYWITPTLVMAFGFEMVKDRWLSRDRWEHFVREVHAQDAECGEVEE